MKYIRIQTDAIDTGVELARLESLPGGAVASFTGLVRDDNGVVALELEHFPGMTEAALADLADTACARWPLLGVVLIHRVGPMRLGERIVLVGTASQHRAAALEACAFLIDRLKTDAPFWKRAHFANGQSGWVEAKESDDQAAAIWDK